MEDDLNNILGQGMDAPDLLSEFAPPETKISTPVAAIRNRAAALAIMSRGDPVKNYQTTVQRISDGTLETSKIWGDYEAGVKTDSLQGAMQVLSSPEYSFEEKQRLIQEGKGIKTPDLNTRLVEKALAADSGDETPEEELVRVNTVDVLDNMLRARAEVQGMVNAHAASLDSNTSKAFFDLLASDLLPFGNNVIQARIAGARDKSLWGTIKALVAPGSDKAAMQEAYFNVPADKAVALASKYIEVVKGNAGVLFGNDNHYAQYSKLQRMLSGEEPSTTETILENLAPLLDIFGIRAEYQAGKMFLRARKAAAELKAVEGLGKTKVDPLYSAPKQTAPTASKGPSQAPDESLLSRAPSPDQAAAQQRKSIAELEAEKAKLLESQNLAAPGDIRNLEAERKALQAPNGDVKELAASIKKANPRMSSKEARVEAQKRIDDEVLDYNARVARIEQQIATNRSAAPVQTRIADLEKQIAILSKGVPENAGSVRLRMADEISRIEWNNVAKIDNPVAVGNIIGSANPSMARGLFASVVGDATGEAAGAIYGTSRTDAIAAQVFPQAIAETGVVTSKVPDIGRSLLDEKIQEAMKPSALLFSADEAARADAAIHSKFAKVSGLTVNDAMGGVHLNRDGAIVNVSAVYGSPEGGFLTAKQAMEQTLFALREMGAKAEDVEILARDGISHVPVKKIDDTEGSFYARLKMPYETKAMDVGTFDPEDVKMNVFDNAPTLMGNQYTGSLTRNLVDVASMFTGRFTGATGNTSRKSSLLDKLLLDELKDFTDRFDSLSSIRKKKMQDYLKEANMKQISDNPADLVARGFTADEMDTIKSFRNFWDTTYHIENSDFVRTLSNEGWQLLQHPTEKFVAKQLPPNMWGDVKEFLDPRTGNIEMFDQAMRININNSGGYLAALRRPADINGKVVSHIFVDNNASSYLRAIRESDQILSKLDGYYSVVYKAARYVDRVTYGPQGNVIDRRAVAVAGDWATAENFAKRQISTGNEQYVVRGDDRAMRTGSDDWFDVNSVKGRISQRHRGKPLEEAGSGPAILGDESFVLSPVDSAVRAARSIAGRVVARPMLENAKARFVQQYREFLIPSNGEYRFPKSISDIGQKGIPTTSEMADARSTWEYINYLEQGYINSADQVTKQFFNSMSMIVGKAGLSRTERALGAASEVAPMAAVKAGVFNTMVGTNILRNWIVQTWQFTRLPVYDPIAFAKIPAYIYDYVKATLRNTPTEFSKFVDESGFLSSVDKQNLVRGSIENAMDHSSTILRKASAPIKAMRMAGFDAAEMTNYTIHAAAVFDKFKRAGKNLNNARVKEEAFAEIGHLTGNMNYSADFPYNQTALSAATQFLQAPHKMLLQTTNRALPWQVRARLFAWDAFFWGAPTALIYNSIVEEEIPDPEVRKIMVDGAWQYALNTALKKEFGSDLKVDISSLAPNDLSGFAALYQAVMTGGADELMTHTPAGSLFGEQGRVQQAIRMWSQYFKGFYADDLTPVQFDQALKETAKILPLVNNAYKAKLILDYNERRNARGAIVEEDVPDAYAYFQAFGFGSKGLADLYKESKRLSEATKANEDSLYQVYRHSMAIMAATSEESLSDLQTRSRTVNTLLAPYKDIPWAQKKMTEWLNRDMIGQDLNTHIRLMKLGGVYDEGDIRRSIERMPNLSEEEKKTYIDTLQKTNKEIEEGQ